MVIRSHYSLKSCNSFGINAFARRFGRFSNTAELNQLIQKADPAEGPLLILGGGSNILFRSDFEGMVLKNEIAGISIAGEDSENVFVKAGAGEHWDKFVQHAIALNLGGVENLSLIPGSVGASPIQNIGAYGVELKDCFHELEAYDIGTGEVSVFNFADCRFGYRDSVFKHALKNKAIILNVTFRLAKSPVINTRYGAIEDELRRMHIVSPSIRDISDAVIAIRRSKLPDPAVIGNAGSFFKNPELPVDRYRLLKEMFPGIPGYPGAEGMVKIAAGWLIEQCGWKGYRRGDVGVHARQALVLVNYGGAKGDEIYALSTEILQSVDDKFKIVLEREVNIV